MNKIYPRHTINFSKEILHTLIKIIKDKQIVYGQCHEIFETEFANYHKTQHALGLFSGSSGLFLSLKALGFNPDDEIIVSAFNLKKIIRIIQGFGLKPIFADVDPLTFNMDIKQIEKKISNKTKAILVTHTFGQPCEIHSILALAKKHNLKIIEDCAHACGAEYNGQKVGTFGDIGIFSFALGKNIPCFGGGALITNNKTLWGKILKLNDSYFSPSKTHISKIILSHLLIYFLTKPKIFPYTTYPLLRILDFLNIDISSHNEEETPEKSVTELREKMFNLQAATGIKQLEKIDYINNKLRTNALLYHSLLKDIQEIQIPAELSDSKSIYLYYTIVVKNRKTFRRKLLRYGIDTERNHLSLCAENEPFAANLALNSIEIPNNIYLTENDIKYIAQSIRKIVSLLTNEKFH